MGPAAAAVDSNDSINGVDLNSKCANCSCKISVSTHVALYKIRGRTMTVIESLQLVFNVNLIKIDSLFSSSSKPSYKFCSTCGENFGRVIKPILQFLDLTVHGSPVWSLAKKPVDQTEDTKPVVDNLPFELNSSGLILDTSNKIHIDEELELEDFILTAECQYSDDENRKLLNGVAEHQDDQLCLTKLPSASIQHDDNSHKAVGANTLRRSPRICNRLASTQTDTLIKYEFPILNGMSASIKIGESTLDSITRRLHKKYQRHASKFPSNTSEKSKCNQRNMSKGADWKCESCGVEFSSSIALSFHRGTHARSGNSRPHSCFRCNRYYQTKKGYLRHLSRKHAEEYRYNLVGKSKYKCDVCSKVYNTRHQFRSHVKSHQPTAESNIKCDKCDTYYSNRSAYLTHSGREHPEEFPPYSSKRRELTEEELELLKTSEFKCAEFPCESISFETWDEWLVHQRDLHGLHSKHVEKDFTGRARPCPQCGKRLFGQRYAIDHIRVVHMGDPQHACDICGKEFARKAGLSEHIKKVHSHSVFLCAQCGMEFKSAEGLSGHTKRVHINVTAEPVKKFFECAICHRKIFSRARFKDHMAMSHSTSNEFPFPCDLCGKRFKAKNQMKDHRDYCEKKSIKDEICAFCGKSYAFKKYLRYHLIHTHKLSMEEARHSAGMKLPLHPKTKILPNGEMYDPVILKPQNNCIYCDKKFPKSRRDKVCIHLITDHGMTKEEAMSITQFTTKRQLVMGPKGLAFVTAQPNSSVSS